MTFISRIANYIIDNYDLTKDSLIVVFPNKRAALNLRSELSNIIIQKNSQIKSSRQSTSNGQSADSNIWLPQMLSIQEAMTTWSGLQMIDNVDIIYELINIINKDGLTNINSNIFGIASQMIKDFDEIDQYDIDAEKLFNHINEAKQLEIWTPDMTREIETSYIKFFAALHGYYKSLREILLQNNCGYYGMISRKTNELKDDLANLIGDKKIIFAGFNAMTKTEEDVIVRLVESNKAVLLWDLDKYYYEDKSQEAGMFARSFFERNPQMERNFITDNFSKEKTINIIAVSGNSIQANALQIQLEKEINQRSSSPNKDEAIVLAEESLLIPVLNSLPERCSKIQVTMGFPYADTIINNFIESLFYLQENINANDKQIYFWSLVKIINNDFFKNIFSKEDIECLSQWKKEQFNKSTYHIDIDDYESLKSSDNLYRFMTLISTKWLSTDECIVNLKDILIKVSELIIDKDPNNFLKNQLSAAGKIINKISRLINKYEQHININDIKMLYTQTAFETNISLKGSRDGLQIMGLLETRNLDFDTIHILSVNEGILPQSKNNNSLIPFDLRNIYKLPIYKNKQAVYAYHFYRLLQNANTINIYYNTLSDAMGEGEASRFIFQLTNELSQKHSNIKINELTYKSPDFKISKVAKIEVNKTNVIDKIKNKLSKGSGLSPTSISCYLNCPLQFYLKYIEKIQDNTPEETIQSNVIGSIIHDTFQYLYERFGNETITPEIYNKVATKENIDISLENALVNNKFKKKELPKTGFNYLNKILIDKLIKDFIEFEKKQLESNSISIIGLETDISHYFNVNGIDVKLAGRADRIDSVNNTIRVLDYKTGSVKKEDLTINSDISSLDKLTPKALQLIIYKYLYLKTNPEININNVNIEPGIIGLRKLSNGIFILNNNSETFENDNFIKNCDELFTNLFAEILDTSIPFKQVDDENKCTYCDFKTICKRNPKTYY